MCQTKQTYGVSAGVLMLLAQSAALGQTPPPSYLGGNGVTYQPTGVVNGQVQEPIGQAYNTYLAVNDQPGYYRWVIYGQNFSIPNVKPIVILAGRAVPVISYTPTTIVADVSGTQINPLAPWNWSPICTWLQVQIGNQSTYSAVNICPCVGGYGNYGVVFSQCTWWVAIRKGQLSNTYPTPTPYSSFGSISTNWTPQRGDQLAWGTTDHQAIIESVQTTQTTNQINHQLTISQYNIRANQYSTFTTSFQVTRQGASWIITKLPQYSSNSPTARGIHR